MHIHLLELGEERDPTSWGILARGGALGSHAISLSRRRSMSSPRHVQHQCLSVVSLVELPGVTLPAISLGDAPFGALQRSPRQLNTNNVPIPEHGRAAPPATQQFAFRTVLMRDNLKQPRRPHVVSCCGRPASDCPAHPGTIRPALAAQPTPALATAPPHTCTHPIDRGFLTGRRLQRYQHRAAS
ncbi:hypothetical protein PSPO01_05998 [Paraphaeosphaeria sporulosa]